MGLFQKSVVQKHLSTLDFSLVDQKFSLFRSYFSNQEIQQNVRQAKEEQFQEGFLRELFVKIFDYTLNPDQGFNLTTELKNISNNRKADGAILKAGKAIAIIELKSALTTDLDAIETQAFGYKNHHPNCVYVVTSNFSRLRFYIQNAVEHIDFDLFNLTREQFVLLWLCLSKESLLNDIPLQIKESSVQKEEDITRKFYHDYSEFRNALFGNIAQLNPGQDKLLLFNKTQKLLDRFLFVLFAEDRQLLPPNSINEILKQWGDLKEKYDTYFPLYDRFKKYFGYLNSGYRGAHYEIFPFNGGLFALDETLDSLRINDELLFKHASILSKYDFETEVDVNILGHIFEHSLSEIETLQAEIAGAAIDRQPSKRKKDGIFYTPKFITQYLIEQTVGKICTEKRNELEIREDNFHPHLGKPAKKDLLAKLEAYRTWLLQLKILDPACGSGAFLNQALVFLIEEHRKIDELKTVLLGGTIILSEIENEILEKNIFGVDVNEESVEIAKLSLWLRTARKGRKLNTLSNNIKCGNSLIDDPSVAGNKSFNWFVEFPQVFPFYRKTNANEPVEPEPGDRDFLDEVQEPSYSYKPESKGFVKHGFDVIIGNPPYVRAEMLGYCRNYLSLNYEVFNPSGDLFSFFYERSLQLLKRNTGVLGFISNTFDKTSAGIELRRYLQNKTTILKYVDFTGVQIFEGATTYPVVFVARNQFTGNNAFEYVKIPGKGKQNEIDIDMLHPEAITQTNLNERNWTFSKDSINDLLGKLICHRSITEKYGKTYYGIKTALNEAFIITKRHPTGEHVKPIYEGREIEKWATPASLQQLILFQSGWTKKQYGKEITENDAVANLKRDFPELISHLEPFEPAARKRYDQGDFYWELRNCAYYELFDKPKIIFPNLQNCNKFAYDESGAYINAPAVILPTNDKFLVAILNSKLIWFFLKSICIIRNGGYIEVKPQYFEQIPIPPIPDEIKADLERQVDMIIAHTNEIQLVSHKFVKLLSSHFPGLKITRKLQSWFDCAFSVFMSELKKQKTAVRLKEEAEWMEYFENQKAIVSNFRKEIQKLESAIDLTVFSIYGLSKEEIALIEL